MKTNNQRALAAQCLQRMVKTKLSLPIVIQDQCENLAVDKKPLVQELCYGSCRYFWQLQGLIDPLLQKPLRAKDHDVYYLLFVGAYQLLYMRLPAHAALSETVNATKSLGKQWARGMVNGVLRNIQRDHQQQLNTLADHQQQALPQWLSQRLQRHWPDQLTTIAAAFKTAAPLTLRVNRQKISRDNYLIQLETAGFTAEASKISDDGIILTTATDVTTLPNFDQGFCSVQDEAAQLSAKLTLQQGATKVLDACAAPGGKSCHLLELSEKLQLTAVDNDEKRIGRVSENLDRLGLNATVLCDDVAATDSWWNGEPFDAILLDAPCSATGVIRRNPDIKVLRSENDALAMPAIQQQILMALWPTLKSGGRLVYATCSLLPEENDEVIANCLPKLAGASLERPDVNVGIATEYGVQLMPSIGGNDGFYYACIHKS